VRELLKITTLTILSTCFFFSWNSNAQAETLEITGNGESAISSIEQNNHSGQTVVSSNEVNINNNIQIQSNTGSTTITTGNSSSTTNVENSANTNSINDPNCCIVGASVNVSENGSNTMNSVSIGTKKGMSVESNNTAKVSTSITNTSQTGANTANNNTGITSITTGNIQVTTQVKNNDVNGNTTRTSLTNSEAFNINVSGNGAGSETRVMIDKHNNMVVYSTNIAEISNIIEQLSNTGNNIANNNTGNVIIRTGDISVTTLLENVGINSTIADVTSCCPNISTTPNNPPDTDPGRGGGTIIPSSSSTSSGGMILGATTLAYALGEVLPATGANTTLWATVFNVFMLLMGLYLRNRSGRSPAILTIEITF